MESLYQEIMLDIYILVAKNKKKMRWPTEGLERIRGIPFNFKRGLEMLEREWE